MNRRGLAVGQLRQRLNEAFDENLVVLVVNGPNGRQVFDRAFVAVRDSMVRVEVFLDGTIGECGSSDETSGEDWTDVPATGVCGERSTGSSDYSPSVQIGLGENGRLF